jgi:hypothetical protein
MDIEHTSQRTNSGGQWIISVFHQIIEFLSLEESARLAAVCKVTHGYYSKAISRNLLLSRFDMGCGINTKLDGKKSAVILSELKNGSKAIKKTTLAVYSWSSHDYDQHPKVLFNKAEQIQGYMSEDPFYSSKGLEKANIGSEHITVVAKAEIILSVDKVTIDFYSTFHPSNKVNLIFSMTPPKFSERNTKVGCGFEKPKVEEDLHRSIEFDISDRVSQQNRRVTLDLPKTTLGKYLTFQFTGFPNVQQGDMMYYVAIKSIKVIGRAIEVQKSPVLKSAITGNFVESLHTDEISCEKVSHADYHSTVEQADLWYDLGRSIERQLQVLTDICKTGTLHDAYKFSCNHAALKYDPRWAEIIASTKGYSLEEYLDLCEHYGCFEAGETGLILLEVIPMIINYFNTHKESPERRAKKHSINQKFNILQAMVGGRIRYFSVDETSIPQGIFSSLKPLNEESMEYHQKLIVELRKEKGKFRSFYGLRVRVDGILESQEILESPETLSQNRIFHFLQSHLGRQL